MAKSWRCMQCGYKAMTGIQESLADDRPNRCENCGNEDFEVLRVRGTVHQTVDGSGDALSRQSTRRGVLGVLGGGALVASGSWWFLGRPTVGSTTEVGMHDAQFHPRNIEVDTGTTVTWANEAQSGQGEAISYFLRSATADWEFRTEVPEEESVSHTFEESGVYGVYVEGLGGRDLTGMSMKIGVGTSIDEPLGGWF